MSRKQSSNGVRSSINEKFRMIQLHPCRSESCISYYENNSEYKIGSKWSIVRQRLPDILALSSTYKPTNVRTQLILLIALMNQQANQIHRLSESDFQHDSTNVIVNIDNRSSLISLKSIPIEQMIHVDIGDRIFSIPTRKFILAISKGYAYETAAKYCPPAITDMLINLSKTKVVSDRQQYKRALFKRRMGKAMFFSLFIFINGMILILIISTVTTILNLNSFNHTNPNFSLTSNFLYINTDEY